MSRCLRLAANGRHVAPPNPMVGAVIVAPDGRIIGEGWHKRCGGPHAEVNAFASVSPEDESLLHESTIYVSLEPCAHFGKTPPCANLIVEKGVRRCVVGCVDPFAKVKGRGIEIVREAGIEVTVGVMEQECRRLNKAFITYHSLRRPYITLKWAQTADGFIGYEGQTPEQPLIISNSVTKVLCHRRRAEHQAILVGRRTWETDRPRLDVRHWTGDSPHIVVLSSQTHSSLRSMLDGLYADGIQSLLVEGGSQTLQSFIDDGLWDEAYVETAPRSLSDLLPLQLKDRTGVPSPRLRKARAVCADSFMDNRITTFERECS